MKVRLMVQLSVWVADRTLNQIIMKVSCTKPRRLLGQHSITTFWAGIARGQFLCSKTSASLPDCLRSVQLLAPKGIGRGQMLCPKASASLANHSRSIQSLALGYLQRPTPMSQGVGEFCQPFRKCSVTSPWASTGRGQLLCLKISVSLTNYSSSIQP